MKHNTYRPQTKFAKAMFLHLSVILFTGGVSASVHAGIHNPPPQCMLGDTGNKRAVRILLECILVVKEISPFNLKASILIINDH